MRDYHDLSRVILINNTCRLKDLSYAIVNSMHLRALVFFTFPLSLAGKHACMYFLSLRNMRLGARFHLIMSRHRAYGRPKRESRGCNVYFCTTTVRYVKEGGKEGGFSSLERWARQIARFLLRSNEKVHSFVVFAFPALHRGVYNVGKIAGLDFTRLYPRCRLLFFPLLSFGAYFLHESRNDVFRDFY